VGISDVATPTLAGPQFPLVGLETTMQVMRAMRHEISSGGYTDYSRRRLSLYRTGKKQGLASAPEAGYWHAVKRLVTRARRRD